MSVVLSTTTRMVSPSTCRTTQPPVLDVGGSVQAVEPALFCLNPPPHAESCPSHHLAKAASTAPWGELAMAMCPPSPQLSRATTGRPTLSARPIDRKSTRLNSSHANL